MKKNQYRKFYDKKYLINQEQQKPFPMKNIMDLGNSFGQINTNLDYKSILNYLNKNEMLIENLKRMLSNNPNLNNKNSVGYSNINYYRGQDTINDFSPLLLSNKNQSINSINQISNHPFSNVKEKSEISLPNDFFQQFIKAGVN